MDTHEDKPRSPVKMWSTAVRVWSFPASTMPVAFGTVMAVTVGGAPLNLILFLAALVAMVTLHAGANLLNDVYDYRNGLDRQVNPATGAVARGWISPRQAWQAGVLCMTVGSALGLLLVVRVGLPILYVGAVGVLIGIVYTWGPWPLKYHALGDLAVFLDFGILGALGAWTVQTGHVSWAPAAWAVPMSLLVIAILHANNWRDIGSDTDGRIRTVASILGDTGSLIYQHALLFAPFAIILLLMLLTHVTNLAPRMPVTFLITLLAAPLALRLGRTGARRHDVQQGQAFAAMDGAAAQLNLLFGLLCVAALGLHVLIK